MTNIMLDLETMGKGPNAAIISIGAVAFDLHEKKLGLEFYKTIDLRSSVELGGIIDPETVIWWLQQSDSSRFIFSQKPDCYLYDSLNEFSRYLKSCGDLTHIKIWGNSSAFDNVILRSAYERANIDTPWHWWNDRCYRTVKSICSHIKYEHNGTKHNALDDAKSQAIHLMKILWTEKNENA